MSDKRNRIAPRKVSCLQRMLGCCFVVPDDELDDDDEPQVDHDALARFQEEMRRADQERFLREKAEKVEEAPTEAALALGRDERLKGARIDVDSKAEQAWAETTGGHLAPAKVVAALLDQVQGRFPLGDNVVLQMQSVPNGVSLTLNCRKSPDKAEAQGIPGNMAWDRRACEMSVTRTILRGKDGIEVVDDRTDMRGGGCKELYHALLPLYAALGATRVTMTAKDVGSYAWVGYGFRPDADAWKGLRAKIADRLDRYVDAKRISEEDAAPVRKLLASDDPETIAAIAAIKAPVLDEKVEDFDHWNEFKTAQLRLGQVLLVGQGWDGSLDLTDEAAVTALKKHVGIKG